MKNYASLQPHQQRVVEEADLLEEKIRKLTAFVAVPNLVFDGLDRAEQRRLKMQYAVMGLYAEILQDRIDHF